MKKAQVRDPGLCAVHGDRWPRGRTVPEGSPDVRSAAAAARAFRTVAPVVASLLRAGALGEPQAGARVPLPASRPRAQPRGGLDHVWPLGTDGCPAAQRAHPAEPDRSVVEVEALYGPRQGQGLDALSKGVPESAASAPTVTWVLRGLRLSFRTVAVDVAPSSVPPDSG
jgi:hypothetical protein